MMKEQGAVIVDPADIPTLGKFDDTEFEVLLYEFKADLNAYLDVAGPGAPVAYARTTSSRSTSAHADRGDAVLRPGDHGDGARRRGR